MKFQKTFLRKNRIEVTANIADQNEYRAEILSNGEEIGVPLYQTAFRGQIVWRLDHIINAANFYDTLPDADTTEIVIIQDFARTFQLQYQRADGSGSPTTVNNIIVQNGGVPDYVFNAVGNPQNAINTHAHRLTYQPAVKRIAVDQPEFIYFFNNVLPAQIRVNIAAQIRFEDGTTLFQNIGSKTIVALDMCIFNVSPWVLEEYLLNRPIIGYDITITDFNGNKLFPDHSYEIDTRYHQSETFLLYQNSSGCWDSLRCFGDISEQEGVTRSFAENITGRRVFDARGRRTLKLFTGHQEQGIKEALPDLLYSAQIYRFDGLNSVRLNLLTDSLEATATTADQGTELNFEYITEDIAYAP
jgi:hypothetical protein